VLLLRIAALPKKFLPKLDAALVPAPFKLLINEFPVVSRDNDIDG
jgi:hypothetical protein